MATVVAALMVIAAAISTFIVSIVRSDVDDPEEYLVDEVNGVFYVDPGPGLPTPSSPPNISPPTSPPPDY